MEEFKTLAWKDPEVGLRYAVVMSNELCSTATPVLMPMTAKMEVLQSLYPELDLSRVELKTIRVIDNETR